MWYLTGSQWRCFRVGVMWSRPDALVIGTDWSLWMDVATFSSRTTQILMDLVALDLIATKADCCFADYRTLNPRIVDIYNAFLSKRMFVWLHDKSDQQQPLVAQHEDDDVHIVTAHGDHGLFIMQLHAIFLLLVQHFLLLLTKSVIL